VVAISHFKSFFGEGIRIQHTRSEYPADLIFYPTSGAKDLPAQIARAGFVPLASASAVPARQGLAVRTMTVVLFLGIWNGLILLDMIAHPQAMPGPGPFTLLAVGGTFVATIALLRVPRLQKYLLKPGRDLGEVRGFLHLLLLCSGTMFVGLLLFILPPGIPPFK
jgi:hypothetical protein